jgi:hypothetical protein
MNNDLYSFIDSIFSITCTKIKNYYFDGQQISEFHTMLLTSAIIFTVIIKNGMVYDTVSCLDEITKKKIDQFRISNFTESNSLNLDKFKPTTLEELYTDRNNYIEIVNEIQHNIYYNNLTTDFILNFYSPHDGIIMSFNKHILKIYNELIERTKIDKE